MFLFRDLYWEWWSNPAPQLDLRHLMAAKVEITPARSVKDLTVSLGDWQAVNYQ